MASRNLTGPYRIRHLKLNAHTVATNKAPHGPYRGVARPGATFAIERLVDEVALELEVASRSTCGGRTSSLLPNFRTGPPPD